MEVSKEIIEKAFSLLRKDSSDTALDTLLHTLSSHSINEILNSSTEVREVDAEIHSLMNGVIYRGNRPEDEVAAQLAKVISSTNEYFSKSVVDGDLKSLLIFLSVNCYLKVDIDLFIHHLELSAKSNDLLTGKVIDILRTIKFQTVIPASAPYHEKELKQRSEEGFEQNDVEKVYDFILAMERGGRGFHFNFLVENIIQFLFHIDRKQFQAQLTLLKQPEEMVFYLQSFSKDHLIEIVANGSFHNKWLLHELIRQIVEKEKREESPHERDKQCVANCLHEMFQCDPNFYTKSVSFFKRSKLFNAALGLHLLNLDDDKISEIITFALPIDKYALTLEARTLLLEEFGKSASTEKIALIARTAYNNWISQYQFLYRSREYQNDLLLTDYANFVVQHLASHEDIAELMKSALNKLKWINCEWVRDEIQQITRYNLYLTDVYLLSYAFKNKQIVDPQIGELVAQLKLYLDFEISDESEKSGIITQIESNVKT